MVNDSDVLVRRSITRRERRAYTLRENVHKWA
jgi:hypothetical protein